MKKNVIATVIALLIALWILMNLSTPKVRVQEQQKNIDGFSVTGSGVP